MKNTSFVVYMKEDEKKVRLKENVYNMKQQTLEGRNEENGEGGMRRTSSMMVEKMWSVSLIRTTNGLFFNVFLRFYFRFIAT